MIFWQLICISIIRKKSMKTVYNLSWKYTLPELWSWSPCWNKIRYRKKRWEMPKKHKKNKSLNLKHQLKNSNGRADTQEEFRKLWRTKYHVSQSKAKGSVDLVIRSCKVILMLLLEKIIPISEFSSYSVSSFVKSTVLCCFFFQWSYLIY